MSRAVSTVSAMTPSSSLPDHDCTAAQMPAELKNQLSHRGQALAKLKAALAAAH